MERWSYGCHVTEGSPGPRGRAWASEPHLTACGQSVAVFHMLGFGAPGTCCVTCLGLGLSPASHSNQPENKASKMTTRLMLHSRPSGAIAVSVCLDRVRFEAQAQAEAASRILDEHSAAAYILHDGGPSTSKPYVSAPQLTITTDN
jgi:hypothetical protein